MPPLGTTDTQSPVTFMATGHLPGDDMAKSSKPALSPLQAVEPRGDFNVIFIPR